MLCADHGPCVSGAHNAIVTSRAGKDLVSCLVSGLLTIGPRFGGAIDDAARCAMFMVGMHGLADFMPPAEASWFQQQGVVCLHHCREVLGVCWMPAIDVNG